VEINDPSVVVAIGDALAKAFQELRAWVSQRRAQTEVLDEKELAAVRAFQKAVVGTSQYVGNLDAGAAAGRARELEIAGLWSDAAIAFYGVNDKVAPLLHLKALSWSRPAQWIEAEVVRAGITLQEMNDLLLNLLAGRDPKSSSGAS
jgi:hypothetical protein